MATYAAHFPESIEFPQCLESLAELYNETMRWEEEEELLKQACYLYQTHHQQTLDYAKFMMKFGVRYSEKREMEHAKEYLRRAFSLFSARFPEDTDYKKCKLYIDLICEEQRNKPKNTGSPQGKLQLHQRNRPGVGKCRLA